MVPGALAFAVIALLRSLVLFTVSEEIASFVFHFLFIMDRELSLVRSNSEILGLHDLFIL